MYNKLEDLDQRTEDIMTKTIANLSKKVEALKKGGET